MPRTSSPARGGGAGESLRPGISRIDQESRRTHGYFVRVGYQKTSQGWRPQRTSFFGDATHGGRPEALKAAERWLRQARRELAASAAAAGTAKSNGVARTSGRKTAKTAAGRPAGRTATKSAGKTGAKTSRTTSRTAARGR